MVWHSWARRGKARCGVARFGTAWNMENEKIWGVKRARPCTAWLGGEGLGKAWFGEVRLGGAWNKTRNDKI